MSVNRCVFVCVFVCVCVFVPVSLDYLDLSLSRARALSLSGYTGFVPLYLHACEHAHVLVYIHIHTHTHTRARTHAHTHTHIHNHGHGRSEETRRGGMGGYGRPGAGEMYSAHNMRSTGYMTMDMARMYDTGKGVEDYRRMVHTHTHTHTHMHEMSAGSMCSYER